MVEQLAASERSRPSTKRSSNVPSIAGVAGGLKANNRFNQKVNVKDFMSSTTKAGMSRANFINKNKAKAVGGAAVTGTGNTSRATVTTE